MYTVYKHLNNEEEIIYIGKSKSLLHRQRQHSKNSEWFDEIDSIEYCVLDSKIEMDIVELYLINTLNPKYNKKDKREDKVDNINIRELNWLEFDICELYTDKILCKPKNFDCSYEDFIFDNIGNVKHVSCFVKNGYLNKVNADENKDKCGKIESIEGINYENKFVKTSNSNVYNFSDIMLHNVHDPEFSRGCCFVDVDVLYIEDFKDFIVDKLKNKPICIGYASAKIFYNLILVENKKDKWISNLDWK